MNEKQRDVLNFVKYNPPPDNSHSKDGQGHMDKYPDTSTRSFHKKISHSAI